MPGTRTQFWTIFCALLVLGVTSSCIEEIPIDPRIETKIDVEKILVVEATLTDELQTQQLRLSRAIGLGNDSISDIVENATITVQDDQGNTFSFTDQGNSVYQSTQQFAVQAGRSYQLLVTTSRGEQIQSDMVRSQGISTLDSVYAERIVTQSGIEGIGIFADSSDPAGVTHHFQYQFEETYKIIAPNWNALELRILNDGSNGEVPEVDLIERQQEEQVCFNTLISNELVLSSAEGLDGNQVKRNLVQFVSAENPIIANRYSILVKQILLSPEAYSFYEQLNKFSRSESVFSQVQPGQLQGNLRLVSDPGIPVIGYFNVASVMEKRLFLNFRDLFPDDPLPPYFGDTNCTRFFNPFLGDPERDGPIPPDVTCGQSLIELLQAGDVVFYAENPDPTECAGPYVVTQRECGDCTALGINEIPDFWIEN